MIYRDYLKDKNQNSIKFKEAEGSSPLAFSHSKGRDLKNYQIYGNSTQKTTGKNLFDKSISIRDPIKNETELPNTIYGYSILEKNKICDILKPNTTYTISCEIECTAIPDDCTYSTGILGFLIYKTVSGYKNISLYIDHQLSVGEKYQYTKTFTTPLKFDNGGNYDLLCYMNKYLNSANKIVTASVIYRNIQIEEGSTATEYETYHTSPSPEFPSEVESVGEFTTKNLFDAQSAVLTNAVLNDDGTITTLSNSNNIDIYLKAGTYSIKINYDFSDNIFLREGQVASGYIKMLTNGTVSNFTLTSDNYLRISSFVTNGTYNSIMLVDGSYTSDTMPSYEPYHKYDIPITVCGKNLIPYPYFFTTKTINGVTFTDNGDGSITIDGTATANAVFYLVAKQNNYTLDKCGLKIGDRYTISKTLISGDSIANVYFTANYNDKNGTMKQGALASSANTATSTINSDFKSWAIYLLVLKDKKVNNTTIKLQLEKGSSATEYEPYRGIETTHIYLDEPLRKIGDYADYVDWGNQKVVRNVKEKIFDGMESFSDKYIASSGSITYPLPHVANSVAMLTRSIWRSTATIWANNENIAFKASYYDVTTLDEFKTKLSEWYTNGEPLKMYYASRTPTEELISLPTLKTVKGTSIMSVDTTIQPSNMKIKYIRM